MRQALCTPVRSSFFSSLKTRVHPGEETGHSFVAGNHGEARAIHAQFRWHCCHRTSGVLILFLTVWGKDVGTLGSRRVWEAPTLQRAEVGRDESHPLGLNLVSRPKECWGSIEGLVLSCLPNGRLEALNNRLNQPSWCYLLHIFPSEQEQGAARTLPSCCCCNLQHADSCKDFCSPRCFKVQTCPFAGEKRPIRDF